MKVAALVLIALALAGCARFPDRPAPDRDTGGAASSPAAATADAGTGEAAATAPLPSPPPRKPARPALDGEALVGLTMAEAWELLAAPSDTAQESPATVWTYQHAGCRLELFFYFDLESEEQRTLAYDLDAGTEAAGNTRFCLQELAERGAGLNAANGPSAGAGAGSRNDAGEQGARLAPSGEETSE